MTLLHVIEESSVTGLDNPQRIVTSADGITWATTTTQLEDNNLYNGRFLVTASGVFIGNRNFGLPDSHSVIGFSADTGATIAGVADLGDFPPTGDAIWKTAALANFGSSVLIACGQYSSDGVTFWVLERSVDGGVSFDKAVPAALPTDGSEGVAIRAWGAGVGLLSTSEGGPTIYRTTDAGVTWTQTVLSHGGAGTAGQITDFVIIDAQAALAVGSYTTGGETRPTYWKTLNQGSTWTQTVDPFAGLQYPAFGAFGGGTKQKGLRTGLANADGVIVLAMEGNPNYADAFKHFRVSYDGGATWVEGTYTDAMSGTNDFGTPRQVAEADDGAFIVVLDTSGSARADGEIWRGVLGGASITWTRAHTEDFIANGCSILGVVNLNDTGLGGGLPASVALGAPESGGAPICTAFIAGCPQDCPDDPPADAPTVIVNTNVSFLSPLFFLGLGPTAGATVAMTTPADCGAMFANNLAAQECV